MVFVFCIKKLKDRLEEFFSIFFRYTEMNEKILILMQLEDFNRIKRRGGWKIVSVFHFLEKITDIWKQPLVFWGTFLPGNLRCLDSTKSGHTGKIRCSVIAWDIDVFWIVFCRANSKYHGKLGILVKAYIFSWDNMVFQTLWYLL